MLRQEESGRAIDVEREEGAVVTRAADRLLTLAEAPVGTRVRIRYVGDGLLRAQAIRLGVGTGAEVTVWARLPRGPVIVARRGQKVAVGRRLAEEIWVEAPVGRAR